MQYFLKIYNTTTNELVGYYKESNRNCISKIPNGMKYFGSLEKAISKMKELDTGFVRDKDRHYYKAQVIIFGKDNLQSKER